MIHRLQRALLALAFLAVPALAQAPKAGDYFVDDTQLGFKIKMPRGWDFLPGQPNEKNVIGVFASTKVPYINLSGSDVLFLRAWLLRFDEDAEHTDYKAFKEANEKGREEGEDRAKLIERHKYLNWEDLDTWIEAERLGIGVRLLEDEEYKKVKKVPARQRLYLGRSRGGSDIHVWSTLYEIEPGTTVAFVCAAPARAKDWKKWERALESMARTFKRVEIEETARLASAKFGATNPRSAKRDKLQDEIQRQDGWKLHETDNYFVVTNMGEDKLSSRERIDELKVRLEAIRAVYEEDYPPESVAKTLEKRAAYQEEQERIRREEEARKREEEGEDDEEEDEDEEEEDEEEEGEQLQSEKFRTEVFVDPMEASRASVVRVCNTRGEYMAYGGPGGSAGYWSPVAEELVFYGNASGGESDVWIVLNHEAFHQYIYYFYGQIAPHSWYNEGTGDYYSGYQLDRRNRFQLEPNSWRLRRIQVNLREGRYAPLETLVRWSQAEYYGQNKLRLDPGSNYAQGWAFIYFLRTGKEAGADGWNDDWDDILDVYLETLAVTGDLDLSVDKAFEDIDYDELEEAWKAYILDL